MNLVTVNGALLQCTFGAAPTQLLVFPQSRVLCCGQPIATIMDNKPFVNVLPFGMCSNMANPMVAVATAAALGVLTPMPCIPVTRTPWLSMNSILIDGYNALVNTSKLMCDYGGCISIITPGQNTVLYYE